METASYSLGFAFDDLGRVALIEKLKPAWQAGRLNGIGGKIEPGESGLEAMSREFLEETGIHILVTDWWLAGYMRGPVGFQVYVYKYTGKMVRDVKTIEQERVGLYRVDQVTTHNAIENVPALIALCLIPAAPPSNVAPTFELHY